MRVDIAGIDMPCFKNACYNGRHPEKRKMSLRVIEGTWEEIERHKAELVGRHLRVTITPERPALDKQSAPPKKLAAARPKVLTGFGAFKGKIGSSEEFAREKRGRGNQRRSVDEADGNYRS